MRILLIRHGESVDNVAGSRDSPLTNHGVLQIKRLGDHLVKRQDVIGPITHIFTSNLQRAYHTAMAIADAPFPAGGGGSEARREVPVQVCQLPELREKDYGSLEGKKYSVRGGHSTTSSLSQSDSETHDAMKTRIDRFLDSTLVPVLDRQVSDHVAVAVVAHGVILGVVLKVLLERFPTGESPSGFQSNSRESAAELVGMWSNTGVLQAKIELDEPASSAGSQSKAQSRSDPKRVFRLTIELANNLEHLGGLKKTRGGIGSAKFDSRQRTMDSFFGNAPKKRKLDEAQG
ncbi:phosphoglycerate mutase-like protein [Durotheca rogersii]|uniref:phosphoglycerate mutase-like protein n=1 Tax=Durotheca rogersii TaxID=419775 RepID=UPI00221F67D7|nr:phosphoglycerate mutase-like protein [Durotheca rogersii]KAI5864374.1 phosphoglycerate mutase-like protein [Durotheca rogersii]